MNNERLESVNDVPLNCKNKSSSGMFTPSRFSTKKDVKNFGSRFVASGSRKVAVTEEYTGPVNVFGNGDNDPIGSLAAGKTKVVLFVHDVRTMG